MALIRRLTGRRAPRAPSARDLILEPAATGDAHRIWFTRDRTFELETFATFSDPDVWLWRLYTTDEAATVASRRLVSRGKVHSSAAALVQGQILLDDGTADAIVRRRRLAAVKW